jgi:hypothetical protein
MSDPQPSTLISQLLRSFLGLLTGIVVAMALLVAVEFASSIFHPFPPDFGGTQAEMCAHVARYPQWFLAAAVPAWAFTAFAGTWTAKRLGTCAAAITIGVLLTLAVVFNVSMLPYPSWFKIFAVAGVLAGVLLAVRTRPQRPSILNSQS